MVEVEKCTYELYPKTFWQPAEYCENDAEPGEDYCEDHIPDDPDWDSIRKDRADIYSYAWDRG